MVFDAEGYDENPQALVRRGVKVERHCGRHNSAGIWGTMGTSMSLILVSFYLLDPVFTAYQILDRIPSWSRFYGFAPVRSDRLSCSALEDSNE